MVLPELYNSPLVSLFGCILARFVYHSFSAWMRFTSDLGVMGSRGAVYRDSPLMFLAETLPHRPRYARGALISFVY